MPPKSNIWQVFEKNQSSTKCRLCLIEIKTSGNTTNLRSHLKRHHPNFSLEKKSKVTVIINDSRKYLIFTK